MSTRTGTATWKGSLVEGSGTFSTGSGAGQGEVTFGSRFKESEGSNPEELLGAAHATCFSMALSHELSEAEFEVREISAKSRVSLIQEDGDFVIDQIVLDVVGDVGGIDERRFHEFVKGAAENCPVSKALAGPEIQLGEVQLRS